MLTLYVLLLTNFFHSFCRCCGSKSSSVPCTIDSFVRGLVVCSTTGGSQCFTIHIYNYGNYWLVTQYFYLLLHTPPVLSFLFFVNISLSLTLLPSSTLFPFPSPFLSPSLSPSSFSFSSSLLYFCPSFPSSSFFLLLSSTSFYSAPSSILLPQSSPSSLQSSPKSSLSLPSSSCFSPTLPSPSPLLPPLFPPVFPLTISFFVLCSLSSSPFSLHRNFSFSFIVSPFLLLFSFFYLILFSSSYLGFPLYTLFLFLLFSSSFLLSPPPFHRFSLYSILTNFPSSPSIFPFYFYFISLFPPFKSRQLFLLFLFCSTFLSSSHLSLYLRSVFPFRYLSFHLLLLPFPPTLYFTAPSFSFFIVFIFVFTSPFTFSSLIPFPLCRLSQ